MFFLRGAKSANNLEGEGFEPSKAEPSDLQSDPFDRSGTPPHWSPKKLKGLQEKVNLRTSKNVEPATGFEPVTC